MKTTTNKNARTGKVSATETVAFASRGPANAGRRFAMKDFFAGLIPNTRKSRSFYLRTALSLLLTIPFFGHVQAFTSGNIAVFVAASSSANNTTGSIVELSPAAAGPAVTTTLINGTAGGSALRFSGSATSTGYLANSNDGTLLSFTGHNTTSSAGNINTVGPRGVGTLDNSATFNLAATYTGGSGNQTRGATSINNIAWFIADQNGQYTNGTSSASPSGNIRCSKAFGGIVYIGSAGSGIIQVNTLSPSNALTGGTLTGLPGLAANAGFVDFYMVSSGVNGTAFDILYVLSNPTGSATVGNITKFSLVSGSWVANGSAFATTGGFGLAAAKSGSGANLFYTTGTGASSANSVIRLFDSNGYNASLNITSTLNLFTTASGTTIKGIAFAPTGSACVAPSITSVTSNSPICSGSTLSLNVAATGAGLTYAWTGFGTFSSTTVSNPTVTGAATSSYNVTVSNSCGSASSGTGVVVNPVAVASSNSPVCPGSTLNLFASGGTSYSWSGPNSFSSSSQNPSIASVTAAAAGTYTVTVTGTCPGTATVSVSVNTPAAPGVTSPVNLCQGVPAAPLTATGTGLLWYTVPSGGTGTNIAPTPSTASTGSTSYYVSQSSAAAVTAGSIAITGRINNGTPDIWEFVMLQNIPAGTIIYFTDNGFAATGFRGTSASDGSGNEQLIKFTANQIIPAGTIIRTGTTSALYSWDNNGTIQGTTNNYGDLALSTSGDQIYAFTNSNPNNPLFNTVTQTHLYVFDDTNGFEQATTASDGDIPPGLVLGSTAVTFNFSSASFAAFINDGATRNQSAWLSYIANSANWTTGASGTLPSGTINVDLSGFVNCEGPRSQIVVNVYGTGSVSAGSNQELCEGSDLNLSTTGNGTYAWSGPNGFTSTLQNPVISNATAAASGTYHVIVTNNGCSNSSDVLVVVSPVTSAPSVTSPVDYCQNAPASPLSATGSNLLWYTVPAGGTGSSVAPVPSTATPGSTNYYVSQHNAAALAPGSIAIAGRISNGSPDSWAFVALRDIPAGSVIYFTDNGWITGTGFRGASASDGNGNEDLTKFTANALIPAGTKILTGTSGILYTWTTTGTIPGTSQNFASLSLGQAGEQIYAFTNSNPNNPLFNAVTQVHLFVLDDTEVFTSATSSSNGAVPPGLTEGVDAITFNAAYTFIDLLNDGVARTPSDWLSYISDLGNWNVGASGSFSTSSLLIDSSDEMFCESPRATITININANPVCSVTGVSTLCPDGQATFAAPSGMSSYSWSISGDGSISGITTAQIVDADANGSCGGSFTLTLTVTNAAGCTSVCTHVVSLSDTTSPVITCPADMNVNTSTNQCGANVSFVASASDNCGTPVISYSNSPGSFFPSGTTTVTATATDACGNSVSCDFTVTVIDNEGPVLFGIGPNYTIYCPASPVFSIPSATDNCCDSVNIEDPIDDVTYPGPCTNNYITTRTWTAIDCNGNSTTASQTITVLDTAAPVISVNAADATVECDGGGNFADLAIWLSNNGGAQASDACNNVTWSNDYSTLSDGCGQTGTAQITFTATDDCGNSSTTSANFTIVDVTAPSIDIAAANYTAECDGAGNSAELSAWLASNGGASASDVCSGDVTWANNFTSLSDDCGATGSATVLFTATDACGNSSSTSATFTIADTNGPNIVSCPGQVNVECSTDIPAPDANLVTAEDVCSGTASVVWTSDVITNQTCANDYTVTRTYTATDACGNTNICVQLIIVHDDIVPVLVGVPANVTVNCNAVPAPANVTATDNCTTGATVAMTETSTQVASVNSCGHYVYYINRTWVATDACGNVSASGSQQISVVNPGPSIVCAAPQNVQCTSDITPVNLNDVVASHPCNAPITVTWVSSLITNQTCAHRYTYTRTYKVTDVCGNYVTCSQVWNVYDNTLPVIVSGASNVTVQCAPSVPAPNASALVVTENCSGTVTKAFVSDVISGSTCANRYTITRTYRATDVCNNTTYTTQVITVNDNTAPVISSFPANVTVACASSVPAANAASIVATDNCSGTISKTWLTDVISAQTCTNKYTITRTYRVSDVCGNFVTQAQTITVNDNIAPTISCPAAVTVTCASQVPAVNTSLVIASDNCTGSVTKTWVSDVISAQTCANRYTITRTYRATDICGNFSQCTQTITVNDQTAPSITCPAAISVACPVNVPAPNVGTVTASDGCGGGSVTKTWVSDVISNQVNAWFYTITRTYRATDVCGNFSQCTQIINVNGNSSCPPVREADGSNVAEQELLNEDINSGNILENYPDPFKSTTTFRFAVEEDTHAKLEVYDLTGKLISTLFDGNVNAQEEVKVEFSGTDLPSGMYIYKFITTGEVKSGKIMLMKE